MEAQSVSDFFADLLNDPSLLKNAFNLINNKINADVELVKNSHPVQQTFIAKTIQYLSNETQNESQNSHQPYFHIITIFHSPLISHFSSLPETIQDTVRSGLLNAILAHQSSLKCMSALGLFLRQLIQLDSGNGGFNEWLQPLAQLLKWLNSQDPIVIEAGVEFFIFLLKQTSYNEPNSELPLHKFAGDILSVLFGLFTGTQEEATVLRQKILFLVFQVVKTFSIFDGIEDSVVSSCFDGTFELWMSLFSSIIKSSLTSHLGLKKYVIKILVIIYRDMNVYSGKRFKSENASKQLIVVWEFVYRFLPIYLESEVWGRQSQQFSNHYYDDDPEAILNNVEALVHNIIQFISVLVCSPSLGLTVRLSIYHLTNSLFHFYMVPLCEAKTWDCNIHYFVNNPDHEGLRSKVLNVLNELIQKYNDQAIQAILVIAEKFLMNYPQSHTINVVTTIFQSMDIKSVLQNKKLQISLSIEDLLKLSELSGCDVKQQLKVEGQSWRKSEVALSILGRFSEDIIVFQSKQTGVFDIQSFVRGLMKQFSLEEHSKFSSLLKGQSLYCLTRFTQIISIKYKELFADLIASCSICVSQIFPTAVRVAACKILAIYFRKLQKHKLKLSQNHIESILNNQTTENIMTIEITNQTNNFALQALIQIVRDQGLGPKSLPSQFSSGYLLNNFHTNISHQNVLKLSFTLLQQICEDKSSYERIIFAKDQKSSSPLIIHFITQCLQAYVNVITSEQKQYLRTLDTDLIVMVLKLTNMIAQNCPLEKPELGRQIVQILPLLTAIIQNNDDIQVHVSTTICLKNMVRKSSPLIKQASFENKIVQAIHSLLNIPSDKSFQAASIYVGNLTILTFDKLLQKPDQQILKEVVLKVFRSRTPSVIQSLVLIYARLINMTTDLKNPFSSGEWMQKLNNIVDFLASFSIQNRMGLKILTDKWLLQQSLFRGKYTKISTFMALSKLFLLRDKRVDNLLVIGFNPSHTNINNDVNAPLKILATLIRCLNNQIGSKGEEGQDSGEDEFALREESDSNTLEVELQKFKQREQKKEDETNTNSGGLADRENQQGSTCYMSAMLQFYDDGEECDQTTEEDLINIKDCSTEFQLAEYLTDFFLHLNDPNCPNHTYFKECLKDLLKEDVRNLQKHIKITL